MTNEKFTQGEWEIEEHELSVKNCEMFGFRIKTDSKIICAANSNELKNKPEMRANAYLIAAAPEMYRNNEQTLTELEQMIPAMLAVCADCQHRQCKVCRFAKVLKTASEMERRIEQVQKKARGER